MSWFIRLLGKDRFNMIWNSEVCNLLSISSQFGLLFDVVVKFSSIVSFTWSDVLVNIKALFLRIDGSLLHGSVKYIFHWQLCQLILHILLYTDARKRVRQLRFSSSWIRKPIIFKYIFDLCYFSLCRGRTFVCIEYEKS